VSSQRHVWVVTDQKEHHLAMTEFVRHLVRTEAVVHHVWARRESIRPEKAMVLARLLKMERNSVGGGRLEDPVLVFRDSECTDTKVWKQERARMEETCDILRSGYKTLNLPPLPHVAGVVFNPMSEAALLLLDPASDAGKDLDALSREVALLNVLRKDRRQGQAISRDKLKIALPLTERGAKHKLDQIGVSAAATWALLDHPGARPAVDHVVGCLDRAGVRPV
jgi:hypothetical protein